MRLDFEELVITDFKAFRGAHIVPLNPPGVTYLVGDNKVTGSLSGNGAAKSTIWDAFIWCLTGKTPLGLRNPDVKPWAGGKTAVGVRVKVDGRLREVYRTTSPNRFTCDGEDIADIRDVFDMSFELAINTILLPQDKELFLERDPSDKMKLFSEALPLERWDLRSAAADKATKAIESDVVELEGEKFQVAGAIVELANSITSVKKQANEWNDRARQRTRVSKSEVEALKAKREALSKRLATATLQEDGALTELKASETNLRKLQSDAAVIESSIGVLTTQIEVLTRRQLVLEKELRELGKAANCPTCGQPVKPKNLEGHKAHLKEQIAELQEDADKKSALKQKALVQRPKIAGALTSAEKAADVFDAKARDASDAILRLRPEIAELDLQIKAGNEVKDEENPYTMQVSAMRERHKRLTREAEDIDAELASVTAAAEHSRFWVKGFKDIKLQLIEDVLSELELATNSMVEEVGLDGWRVRFGIEREAKSGAVKSMINVEVISPESGDKAVRWESFSGGEKKRLRVVGSLALADVLLAHMGIETNLEILDEPAVYWAGEGVQELVAFLATRAREQDKSIWFIEHSAIDSVHFARTVMVVKDKRGARIAS